ncbi:uncharacterized protein BO66DRAFT_448464 [Aspergillus aculeatinus CBS 121060]|uniref:Uncharacterized protein n=1 Tax=Aspergillus aculeatinus CBS 121060 TaxID=1448322 RepID=A0ACD1HCL4_9EURO|nr:hypothetical protein BO66DRAFT_448464 [Aspergillus aculeatinus CBS 121060]RAH71284.1 hypothetical protein BO66DRAFT_448464 [Aspergillus aculeatinus CBS 121060]
MAQPQPQQAQPQPQQPTLFDQVVTILDSVFPRAEGYIYLRGWSTNTYDENQVLNEFVEISTPSSGVFFTMLGGTRPGVPEELWAGRKRFLHLQSLAPATAGRTLDFKGIVLINRQCRLYAMNRDCEPKRLSADPLALHTPVDSRWQDHAYSVALESAEITHLLTQFKYRCRRNPLWIPPPGAQFQ